MKYRNLGRAGIVVSRLGLGTMNFGPMTPESEAHEIMSQALDLGINFLDTADIYGWETGAGITEQIIGHWFAQSPSRRDQVILATKVYGPMGTTLNTSRLSALHIRRGCDAALRRLQTDHIDLFQMHHVDRSTTWDEVWQAMELLVAQGKVLYVGSSNFAGWHIARAQEIARQRRFLGIVSEQSVYNLMERTVELEVLPACQEYGIGLLPYSPLQGGLLTGAAKQAATGRSAAKKSQELLARHHDRLEAYRKWCAELGEDPAVVGLAWLLRRPGVIAPIIGPRTTAHLHSAARATDLALSKDHLAALDAIFPGPGGPAPEAYAW